MHFPRFLKENAYGQVLGMVLMFVALSAAFRVALLAVHSADFSDLSGAQVLQALVYGLRFDLSLAVVPLGLPMLLMVLPWAAPRPGARGPNAWHRAWHQLWIWVVFVCIVIASVLNASDLVYFGYVHRHLGSEINTLGNDMPAMVRLGFSSYPLALGAFVLGVLALGWAWQRWFGTVPAAPQRRWLHGVVQLLALVPLLVLARGGTGGKPISVGDAFFSSQVAQGHLALSGVFAASRALLESPPEAIRFMPQEEAVALVQTRLGGGSAAVFDTPGYPLQRSFGPVAGAPASTPPNVVVLMLESWGATHIDALRRPAGLPPLGLTPHFDALAQTGQLYTRAYANGQRSIQGASAILASQPTLSGLAFLGEGLEQNSLSFMGHLAQSQGYDTYFLQSSERASLRFDAIAARAGFSHYQGSEDIPNLHPQPKPPATWGTWDHNTLQAAHQQFAAARKPFLGFVFTSSTHVPWLIPEARFKKTDDASNLGAFHNTLFYADWALGQFMDAAKAAGYFDNTIFVLVADHADEFAGNPRDIPNQYHVPLLIVGPGVGAGLNDRIASQFDILPTLIALCGWDVSFAGWGRSLTQDTAVASRASFGVRGTELDWITSEGWLSHNLERSTGQSANLSATQAAGLQANLLATYQLASQLQTSNRVLKPGAVSVARQAQKADKAGKADSAGAVGRVDVPQGAASATAGR